MPAPTPINTNLLAMVFINDTVWLVTRHCLSQVLSATAEGFGGSAHLSATILVLDGHSCVSRLAGLLKCQG